jgi:translation initiation factor 2 subunit 1
VHHVDREKNQVDVSIKRVSEEEKKRKLEMVQNEKRGSKLLEIALKSAKCNVDLPTAKKEIENYFDDVYSCFKETSLKGEDALKKTDLPKLLKAKIVEIAAKSIKKPVVNVDAIATLVCYSPQGIDVIKNALKIEDARVDYLGAPKYKISVTASDYKHGEKKLLGILEHIKTYAQKNNCDFKVDRD